MDSSTLKSSGEPLQQAVALENAKDTENPRTEYEEYLDLNREFTGERLRKLVRKVDWHVLPQLIIIYLLAHIDRNNAGNARLFGAEADMKLSGQDWNTGLSIFFVTYAAGGVAGAFSGLLAYGIGHLDGLFSFLVAASAWFVLNDTPAKVTKWLTPEERRFLVLRARYAAGGETGIAETEKFSWKAAREAFRCRHAVHRHIFNLGYTAAVAQAMTAPPYIFAALVTLFTGWAADRWQQRMLAIAIPNSIAVCGFIIMMVTSRYPELPGATLFLATGGLYPVSPAVTAWIALNCAGSMKRAVGIGAMLSFSQLGGIVGSNIYIKAQSATYPIGFGISLGMLAVFGVIWPAIYWVILKRINAKRAAIPVEEIHAKYTEQQLSDMGDLSPLFRYST
ncbi:high-affinity nicotinic acid transporter [Colletotrichum plurivorum]|uniref:High-affinity nicotinic acid transporter n=1 Tax=Colletotrichum plurivorum TaxID=2175906 RepID=A0A8H6K115_9PEZI|nr:high-affinity nicotinic acid transporter [Colletotrichum plurivorum]